MFDVSKFGANICRLRKASDMTQSELGDKLNVTRQAVSKYENGESFPDISIIILMGEIFNKTIDELIGPGNPSPNEARIFKNVVEEGAISNDILKPDIIGDFVGIAPFLKPSILNKAVAGLSKYGIDISNIIQLSEFLSDESVLQMMSNASYETIDNKMLEKFMPFIDSYSQYAMFEKILKGELPFKLLKILLPYMDYLPGSLIEEAVIEGAISEEALVILHDANNIKEQRNSKREKQMEHIYMQ